MLVFGSKELRQYHGLPTTVSILREFRLHAPLRDVDTTVIRIARARNLDYMNEIRNDKSKLSSEFSRCMLEEKLYKRELHNREALKDRFNITVEMYWEEYRTHMLGKN